jgi:hypothetical protein
MLKNIKNIKVLILLALLGITSTSVFADSDADIKIAFNVTKNDETLGIKDSDLSNLTASANFSCNGKNSGYYLLSETALERNYGTTGGGNGTYKFKVYGPFSGDNRETCPSISGYLEDDKPYFILSHTKIAFTYAEHGHYFCDINEPLGTTWGGIGHGYSKLQVNNKKITGTCYRQSGEQLDISYIANSAEDITITVNK